MCANRSVAPLTPVLSGSRSELSPAEGDAPAPPPNRALEQLPWFYSCSIFVSMNFRELSAHAGFAPSALAAPMCPKRRDFRTRRTISQSKTGQSRVRRRSARERVRARRATVGAWLACLCGSSRASFASAECSAGYEHRRRQPGLDSIFNRRELPNGRTPLPSAERRASDPSL